MDDFEQYLQQSEPGQRAKGYAWQTAIGLQAVDGLKTSPYLLETARRHIEGDITIDEVQHLIHTYYESKDARRNAAAGEEEADKVSANIASLLGEDTVAFSVAGLLAVHRRLFFNVFKHAGKLRQVNLTKKEFVLRGDTVRYVSYHDLQAAITYDLDQERRFRYKGLPMSEIVAHLSQFVSNLWQIHPFMEGNTRTTAVFTILYLRSLGFRVENDLFAAHSWYFRNALVRANFQDVKKGVQRDTSYLEKFFRNLLMDEHHELKNRFMVINPPDGFSAGENGQEIELVPPLMAEEDTSDIQATYKQNTSTIQASEQVRRLVCALGKQHLSLKDLIHEVGLKNRPSFIKHYLNPALQQGVICLLYPESPRHPQQKYLLTPRGCKLLSVLQTY